MNCPLPCTSYGSFKLFRISVSDFGTEVMCGQFCACAYELFTMETKGVVHSVHKVVIRPSFDVIRLHKVSYGVGRFVTGDLRLMEIVST